MDELISKQKVIDKLDEALERITKNVSKESDAYHIVYGAVDITKCMIMTIQPKRGKWIKTARWGRVYYCNQCRNYLDFDGVNAGRGSTNYCPNCGCRMDGGEQK